MKNLTVIFIAALLFPSYVFADLNADLLQHAANGNSSGVQQVLASGADVNAINSNGRTALYFAVLKGHAEVVKTLLGTKGIDVNTAPEDSGWTPLHVAIANLEFEIIELLLAAGADVNKADNDGNTPLHVAASIVLNADIVEILLEAPGIEINKRNKNGKTPLALSADWEIKGVLERAGATF